MKQAYLLLILPLVISMTSCALSNYTDKVETVNLDAFNSIAIGSAFEVDLIQDSSHRMTIEADSEIFDRITYSVHQNTLSIGIKSFTLRRPHKLKLTIYSPDFSQLSLKGAVDLSNHGTLTQKAIKIKAEGAVKVDLNLQVESIKIDSKGSSKVKLKGSSSSLKSHLEGACKLDAEELSTENVYLICRGASKCEVTALSFLDVDADGACHIKYAGSPTVKKNIRGVSVIKQK